MSASPTIHASAVLIGRHAILIRGPSGSGKSRLVLNLIQSDHRDSCSEDSCRVVRLVADDRVHLEAAHGRLMARSPAAVAGRLEIRGMGIRRLSYEPLAVISLVVDLGCSASERMPERATTQIVIDGIRLPRLAVASGDDPLPLVLAALTYGSSVVANGADDIRHDDAFTVGPT